MWNSDSQLDGKRKSVHRRPVALVLAVLVAGATAAALPAGAVAARSGGHAVVEMLARTAGEQDAVRAYWTPERITAMETPTGGPRRTGRTADVHREAPPTDGAPWPGPPGADRTVGRLFFTSFGEDSSCTATVIDSPNRSVVVTAGHCAGTTDLLGDNFQWGANQLYIPGYHDGVAPYGTFVVRAAVVSAVWRFGGGHDFTSAYDQSMLVLGPDEQGRRVMDAVGTAQRIGLDAPADRPVSEFGYPRASADPAREGLPEFNGRRLAYCQGTARPSPVLAVGPRGQALWGVPCVMGGGSSGGPRISGVDPATGLGRVDGVDTEGFGLDAAGAPCDLDDDGCVRHLGGPRFSTAITGQLLGRAGRL